MFKTLGGVIDGVHINLHTAKKAVPTMKFIVNSSALLKQLQQIHGVINANTVLPILEDFLFEIDRNKLTVVATDLETVMKIQMPIEAKDTGRVCIPAKILMDSLKNLPEQPLTFNIDKNFGVEITDADFDFFLPKYIDKEKNKVMYREWKQR
jgi:DNA polymerase III sliding clamp (beta) subunit (PCNA family)